MRPETIDLEATDPMMLYREEVGKFPRLTVEQERELGRLIQQGLSAEIKLHQANCSSEETALLTEQAQQGEIAFDRMVCSNLCLAISVAHRYCPAPRDFFLGDLIQAGNSGLMTAAEKFDAEKGYHFSTYAYPWIESTIQRFIDNQWGPVSVPDYKATEIRQIKRAENELRESLNREPTDQELADRLEIPIKKLTKNMRDLTVTSCGTSLNEIPFFDGEESRDERGDFIFDSEALTPEQEVEKHILKEEILEELKNIKERDRKIIMLHFGFEDDTTHTFAEIGKMFGISRERVRQIVDDSLKIMKGKSRIKELQGIS